MINLSLDSCPNTTQESANKTTIISPNYPNNYSNQQDCTWKLTSPQSHFIEMEIEHFEVGYNCNDYVEIIDELAISRSKKLLKFCGTTVPPKLLTSTGHEVIIRFNSRGPSGFKGFKINYKSVKRGEIKYLLEIV